MHDNADRYMSRPVMSGPGLYDPTSIMNADELNKAQKEGWIKMAFYLLSFFYYLYRYEAFRGSRNVFFSDKYKHK